MRNALLAGSLALLSACGGGGGDDPAPVPVTSLMTKADAQRELANAAGLVITYASATAAARQSAPASFRPNAGAGAAWRLPPLSLPAQRSAARAGGGTPPAAAQTTNCDSGNSTSDSGVKSRGFSYFPTTQVVNWQSSSDSQCAYVFSYDDGSSTTYTSNGFEETGDAASEYSYILDGAGGTPGWFAITEKNAAGATTSRTQIDYLGTVESRTTDVLADFRAQSNFGITLTGAQAATILQTLGGAAPLRVTATPAGALTIDGDYSYSTDIPGCPGGAETFETLQAITTDANGYPNGGELKISSGDAWVIVAFNADGSANLTFSDGGSASLTAAEVQAASDQPGCTTPQF